MRDFWKMIVDYKVSAIVMLCENDKVSSIFCDSFVTVIIRIFVINIGQILM